MPRIANSFPDGEHVLDERAIILYHDFIELNPRPRGRINSFLVYILPKTDFGSYRYRYILVDPNKKGPGCIVAFLILSEYYTRYFQTILSFVRPDIRGQGIGKQLYMFALNDGFTIMSDDTQSQEAHNVWISLVRDPNINTYAIPDTKRNPSEKLPIEIKNNQIVFAKDQKPIIGQNFFIVASK